LNWNLFWQKSWYFSDNQSEYMLNYQFLHDFQHVWAFVLTKSGFFWNPYCWVYVRCSWCSWCFSSFCVFDLFCSRIFEFLYCFRCLICFLDFVLFWVVFRLNQIFCSVYGRTKNFRLTRSKKNWVKGFNAIFGLLFFYF
jgi:hypothetical protein